MLILKMTLRVKQVPRRREGMKTRFVGVALLIQTRWFCSGARDARKPGTVGPWCERKRNRREEKHKAMEEEETFSLMSREGQSV